MGELLCLGAALVEGTQWMWVQGVRVWLAAPGIAGELPRGLSCPQLSLTKAEMMFLGENSVYGSGYSIASYCVI